MRPEIKKWVVVAATTLMAILGILAGTKIAHAQVNNPLWKLQSASLKPVTSSWTLTLPYLAGSGTQCLEVTNAGLVQVGGGGACGTGSGSDFPFTIHSWGNSTSTTIGFANGIISNASSTFSSTVQVTGSILNSTGFNSGNVYIDDALQLSNTLHLPDLGKIGWNNEAVTITHSTGKLTVSSGTNLTASFASTTVASAGTLCISTDCRTSWPTGSAFPFDPGFFAGQAINSTTTGLRLTGAPLSLVASSSLIDYASTTAITSVTASTTNLVVSSVLSSLLKTGATGLVAAAVSGTDYATPAQVLAEYPFDPNAIGTYTVLTQATTGKPWLQEGFFASSTSYVDEIKVSSLTTIDGGGLLLGNSVNDNIVTISNTSLVAGQNIFTMDVSGNSNDLVILNDGRVGIGTSTPGKLLSVHGNGYVSSNLFVGGTITSTSSSASTFPYASTTGITAVTASTTNLNVSGLPGTIFSLSASGIGQSTTVSSPLSFSGSTLSCATCALTGTTLTAGGGLTGGGDLSTNRTFTVGAGTGITVNADDVALTIPVVIASGGTNSTSQVSNTLMWFNGTSITSTTSDPLTVGRITATSSTASIFPYASTTAVTSETASTSNFFGANLVDCDNATASKLLWSDTGKFSCGADQSGGAGAYPFPLTGNATSTLTQFNGGLTAYGTSTIGAGTQTTGLTINGGATTTADHVVLGDILVGDNGAGDGSAIFGPTDYEWAIGFDDTDDSFVIASGTALGTNNVMSVAKSSGRVFFPNNVGFGSTNSNPLYAVDVSNGGVIAANFTLQDDSTETITGSWGMRLGGDGTHPVRVGGTAFLVGYTPGGETYTSGQALISGNTGIGTTSPYAKLSVVGETVAAYFTATTTTASTFPYASTTMVSATTASTSKFFGAMLVDCDNATNSKLLWSDTGVFSCGADQSGGGAASTTLLTDQNTFTGATTTFTQNLYISGTTTGMANLYFTALDSEASTTALATLDLRNSRPILNFGDTIASSTFFTAVMPRTYGLGGVTVCVLFSADVTSGTGAWTVAFENVYDTALDTDADGFAARNSIAAATVSATSGIVSRSCTQVANGTAMDNIFAGDLFRIELTRDVANDTAAGDLELHALEIYEQ